MVRNRSKRPELFPRQRFGTSVPGIGAAKAFKHVDSGQSLKGWIALAKTFWSNPFHGVAVWRQMRYRRQRVEQPFTGRHGDGWIGPNFQKWLMVPEGARILTLRIEYPPRETCRNMRMWLSLNEGEPILDTYSGHVGATITIPVPTERSQIDPSSRSRASITSFPRTLGRATIESFPLNLLDIRWD